MCKHTQRSLALSLSLFHKRRKKMQHAMLTLCTVPCHARAEGTEGLGSLNLDLELPSPTTTVLLDHFHLNSPALDHLWFPGGYMDVSS